MCTHQLLLSIFQCLVSTYRNEYVLQVVPLIMRTPADDEHNNVYTLPRPLPAVAHCIPLHIALHLTVMA